MKKELEATRNLKAMSGDSLNSISEIGSLHSELTFSKNFMSHMGQSIAQLVDFEWKFDSELPAQDIEEEFANVLLHIKNSFSVEKRVSSDLLQELKEISEREKQMSSRNQKLESQCVSHVERVHQLEDQIRKYQDEEEKYHQTLYTLQHEQHLGEERFHDLEEELESAKTFAERTMLQVEQLQGDLLERDSHIHELESIIEEFSERNQCRDDAALDEITLLQRQLVLCQSELKESHERAASNVSELKSKLGERNLMCRSLEERLNQLEHENEVTISIAEDLRALRIDFDDKNLECIETLKALGDLQLVMEQLQKEHEKERQKMEIKIVELEKALQITQELENQVKVQTDRLIQTDDLLLEAKKDLKATQSYIEKLEKHNSELRESLQEAMHRIQFFSEDEHLVDRRLVNQLIVAFVMGKRDRKEILNLMSKILQFTDEEIQEIEEFSTPSMLTPLTSILSPASKDSEETRENFVDMWVNFLLDEIEEVKENEQE